MSPWVLGSRGAAQKLGFVGILEKLSGLVCIR